MTCRGPKCICDSITASVFCMPVSLWSTFLIRFPPKQTVEFKLHNISQRPLLFGWSYSKKTHMLTRQDVYFYPMHLVQEHFSDFYWILICTLIAPYSSNAGPTSESGIILARYSLRALRSQCVCPIAENLVRWQATRTMFWLELNFIYLCTCYMHIPG